MTMLEWLFPITTWSLALWLVLRDARLTPQKVAWWLWELRHPIGGIAVAGRALTPPPLLGFGETNALIPVDSWGAWRDNGGGLIGDTAALRRELGHLQQNAYQQGLLGNAASWPGMPEKLNAALNNQLNAYGAHLR